MDINLYSIWRPVTALTGCGIVLKINTVPPDRYYMYLNENFDGKLYHFVTDFGNTLILTKAELLSNYDYVTTEVYPKERLEKQLRLLREVQKTYFKDLED